MVSGDKITQFKMSKTWIASSWRLTENVSLCVLVTSVMIFHTQSKKKKKGNRNNCDESEN